MPVLNKKVLVVQTGEEVFEDVNPSDVISNHYETLSLCKSSAVTNQVQICPFYQEVLLLTEWHLMVSDTGPLSTGLRTDIADMAVSKVPKTKAEKQQICSNKGENEKNVRKLVALQKVNRIMNNKPWAINRFHIEELRSVSLSISEIVQAILIMAHFHTLAAIKILSDKIKDNETKVKAPVRKRNSLVNGRIEMVRCSEQNCDDEPFLDKPNTFPENTYMFDERLCGITCQRYCDDFGFSILNCLDEQSSLLLDNRFSCLQDVRNSNDASSRRLHAFWKYSQNLLGFESADNENTVNGYDLDEEEKALTYNLCFISDQTEEYSLSDSLSTLSVVTVQETKLQAEIIYALHAVTQFMNW